MRRKFLIALAALTVVGLVWVGIVLMSGSGAPTVTVQHFKSSPSGNAYRFSFQITNCATVAYRLRPRVEVQNGSVWSPAYGVEYFNLKATAAQHASKFYSFGITNLPPDHHLRLRIIGERELVGAAGLFAWLRQELLYLRGRTGLNPVTTSVRLFDYRKPVQIFSEELPSPPAEGLEFAARHFAASSPQLAPTHPVAADTGAVVFSRETVVYKEVGPLAIKADVYHYLDAKTRPVVVSLHGGALIMGHRENLSAEVMAFALTNGYVVVSFDYRLAPETQLPAIIEDIEDAFRWLRSEGPKRFHIDPERVAVTGGSAGGYLTLVSGYRVQPPPRVLLAFYGYGDLIGDWYSSPSLHPRHNRRKISPEEAWEQVSGPPIADARDRKGDGGIFYNFCRQTGQWPKAISGRDPGREAEKFFPYMPLKNVTAAYPPTALIHGTADTDVPFQQSQLMAQELQRHGVAFQFHPIAQAEHGLAGGDRTEIQEAERKAFDFVKLYLEHP